MFPSVLLACGRELTPSRSAHRALRGAGSHLASDHSGGCFQLVDKLASDGGTELKVGLVFLFDFAYCLYRLKGRNMPLSIWVPV